MASSRFPRRAFDFEISSPVKDHNFRIERFLAIYLKLRLSWAFSGPAPIISGAKRRGETNMRTEHEEHAAHQKSAAAVFGEAG
jgi:hypothetical protein